MAELSFYHVSTGAMFEFDLPKSEMWGYRRGRGPSTQRVVARVEQAVRVLQTQDEREYEWATFFVRHAVETMHAGSGFYMPDTDTVLMVGGGMLDTESALNLARSTSRRGVLVLWGEEPPLARIVYPSPLRPGYQEAFVAPDQASFCQCAHCDEWQFVESEGTPCRACGHHGIPTFSTVKR